MLRAMRFAIAAVMLAMTAGETQAAIVFDNGAFSGSQVGRFNTSFTIFEDFAVSSATLVTEVDWSQHDRLPGSYVSTTLQLFNGLPSAGTLLFTTTVAANRTANGSPILFGSYIGYDYRIGGLSIALTSGTYYLGISNTLSSSSAQTTWDQTSGSMQTIAGRYQSVSPLVPGNFFVGENSVFQVLGNVTAQPTVTPEPTSLALAGFAGLGMAVGAWRRRRQPA